VSDYTHCIHHLYIRSTVSSQDTGYAFLGRAITGKGDNLKHLQLHKQP
jgi:hypothetical protein